MNELSMMNSMFSRLANALDWLGLIYVAFMFIVVIWRPNRVCYTGSFRLSIILFAASVISPAVVNFYWNLTRATTTTSGSPYQQNSGSNRETEQRMYMISQCAQEGARMMLGMAVAMGILSL